MAVISVRFAAGAALLAGLFGVLDPSSAQERQNEPGKFDFYMLALSWSPSFCADSAERVPAGSGQRADPQCGARPHSFVVHGLWPQYETGFPEGSVAGNRRSQSLIAGP
jgi:ribonuclease T2